ncbi:MAG: hypothetical protein IRZ16_17950 [Myxococcaceae bacterium]|nr:hypothetical protein [Myxococcaceae bacterium]
MRFAWFPIAATVLALPMAAHAGPTLLEQAERAMDDLDFDLAGKLYQQALKQPATRADRTRAWRGLGLVKAFLGESAAAQRSFEVMLLIDPDATVNTALGPKIARPYEAAKKAVRSRRSQPGLSVERDERSGEVTAALTNPVDPIAQVELHVLAEGREQTVTATLPKPATLAIPPYVDVKAWAMALDDGGGIILERGAASEPLGFPATARPPPAVTAAVEEAKQHRIRSQEEVVAEPEDVEQEGGSPWPLFVGGAVVALAGGAAAAYFLTTPEPLHLPAADHTGQLP